MSWLTKGISCITRIKPISPVSNKVTLKKCLTTFDLIAYGVGCSVGAGVYSLIGIGAAITGPSISLSFLLAGIACIFTSLTYSEFAARVPITGSAYTFVYVTFGELPAWLVGWNLTLGYGISAAGIARSWAAYLSLFLSHLGIQVPRFIVDLPIFGYSCNLLSAFLILACTGILLLGVKESAKFNTIITVLNIVVLAFVVAAGSTAVDVSLWSPFMTEGFHGVVQSAGVIFFAYLGFDMVSCLAEEVAEPQKTLPRAIIGSLVISMSVYISVALVVTGLAPTSVLGPNVPLVNAFDYNKIYWVGRIISFGSLFGLTTAAFTCLMGQPRIFYRMAVDGLLPKVFSRINPQTQVPSLSTIATGILVSYVAFQFNLEVLANIISCGTLQVFTFVNAGVLRLRLQSQNSWQVNASIISYVSFCFLGSFSYRFRLPLVYDIIFIIGGIACYFWIRQFQPKREESSTFLCPCVPLIPCAGILSNVYMMASLHSHAWIGIGIWLAIGLLIYLGYGVHHSELNKMDNYSSTQEERNSLLSAPLA